MATENTYTVTGEKVSFGLTELPGVIIQGADFNSAKDVKEVKNHVGAVCSVVEYNRRVEASISAKMLAATEEATVLSAVTAWLVSIATAAPFSLAAGGSVVMTEFKISKASEEVSDLSISATYFPSVKSAAE